MTVEKRYKRSLLNVADRFLEMATLNETAHNRINITIWYVYSTVFMGNLIESSLSFYFYLCAHNCNVTHTHLYNMLPSCASWHSPTQQPWPSLAAASMPKWTWNSQSEHKAYWGTFFLAHQVKMIQVPRPGYHQQSWKRNSAWFCGNLLSESHSAGMGNQQPVRKRGRLTGHCQSHQH